MGKNAKKSRFVFLFLAVFCARRPADAQQILHRFDGSQAGELFGAVVASLGDLDGDGIPDIGVSAPLASGGNFPQGRVVVYSGAAGAQLFQIDAYDPRGMCWAMASAGDLDGDGVPEILLGTPFSAPPIGGGTRLEESPRGAPLGLRFGAGRALVYSGNSRAVLFVFDGEQDGAQLGHSVDGVGDISGDGVPDFIIGAPYADPMGRTAAGSIFVRSGADGEVIFRFDGANSGDYLGWAVAGVGDLDGDGVPDLLMSAPNASPGGRHRAGSVYLRSGATRELILQFDGEEPEATFGSTLAVAGDIDGDGVPDIIIGAPGASPNGRTGAGSVFVYSGATGKLLFRFDGPESFDSLGDAVAGGADVDGDGVPDIIIGAPSASPAGRVGAGSVFVFSGATGNLIFRFDGLARGDALGSSVAAAGDLTGAGRSAVVVGSPYSRVGELEGAGSVFVLSYP